MAGDPLYVQNMRVEISARGRWEDQRSKFTRSDCLMF